DPGLRREGGQPVAPRRPDAHRLRDRRAQGGHDLGGTARGLQARARALLPGAGDVLHAARDPVLPDAHGDPVRRPDPEDLPRRGLPAVTFTPPIPWTTFAAIAGGIGALVVVAYILKLRRRRHEVPFSKLWQRVLKEKESSSLFRRLRRLISLAVQLAFLALLLLAAVDPKIGNAETSGRNVVVIVDASASMKAQDEGPRAPPRIVRAKAA